MPHHKRKRPKSSRAGCLQCKPHKLQRGKNGAKCPRIAVQRQMQAAE